MQAAVRIILVPATASLRYAEARDEFQRVVTGQPAPCTGPLPGYSLQAQVGILFDIYVDTSSAATIT